MDIELELINVACDFIAKNDCNFFANGINVPLKLFGHDIEVESIWSNKKEHKIYLHCNCEEFSGDLDISYFSDDTQQMLIDVLKPYVV